MGCLDETQGALTEGGLAWICGSSRCLWSLVRSVLCLTWEGRASPEEQHRRGLGEGGGWGAGTRC